MYIIIIYTNINIDVQSLLTYTFWVSLGTKLFGNVSYAKKLHEIALRYNFGIFLHQTK